VANAVGGPANGTVIQDLYLAPERRGARLFAVLSGRHQRALRGRETAPVIERHDGYWHGPTINPQTFTGMAGRVSAALPVTERSSTIGDEKSASYDDPSLRIFRERAARRRR
jgi:hypothetical protein